MNWKPGTRPRRTTGESVPPVLRIEIVDAPRSSNGFSHAWKIGRMASFPWR